jgi:hypothetical protein
MIMNRMTRPPSDRGITGGNRGRPSAGSFQGSAAPRRIRSAFNYTSNERTANRQRDETPLLHVSGLMIVEGTIYPIMSRLEKEGLVTSWMR